MFRAAKRIICLLVLAIVLASTVSTAGQVTFSAPVSYTVGTNPVNILVADFDGDGISDLAIANNGDPSVANFGSVTVLLGKGDGTFRSALNAFAGPSPRFIFSGDFNGDGKLDLLVLGDADPTTSLQPWTLLFGLGDGTFGPPAQIALTSFVSNLVVGDFNNDKKLDLIYVDPNLALAEALGNGDGTFQPPQTIRQLAGQLLVGDFNGDGNLDLAVSVTSGQFDQILLGNGDGTFRASATQTIAGSLFAADLNHNGRTDLISETVQTKQCGFHGTYSDFSLRAFVANSDGSFQPGVQFASSTVDRCALIPGGSSLAVAAIGDFDGDDKVDIALISVDAWTQATSTHFLGGNGYGTFPEDLGTIAGSFAGFRTTADFNGDKLADIAEALTQTTIGVVLNTTPSFRLGAPATFSPVQAGGSVTANVSVNALNGFSNAVSLTCNATHPSIHCSLSPSTVNPGSAAVLTVTTSGPQAGLIVPASPRASWLYALSLPFALLVGACGLHTRQLHLQKCLLLLAGALVVSVMPQLGCGGRNNSVAGGNPGTPPGTYAITLMGTSGSLQQSTTAALTVR